MLYRTHVFLLIGIYLLKVLLADSSSDSWNEKERAVNFNLKSCDNKSGQCTTRVDCNRRGGSIEGTCSLPLLVCCKVELKCGNTTSQKVSYFSNNGVSQPTGTCALKIKPTNKRICQLRIDFETFALSPPRRSDNNSAFSCLDDSFVVTSKSDGNFRLAPLCGDNFQQHIYVPVNVTNTNGVISTLTFQISNGSSPTWKLKITQLECPQLIHKETGKKVRTLHQITNQTNWFQKKYDVTAPPGCLQYYTTDDGTFSSFNYNNSLGPYIAGLRYSICFQRPSGACGIRFVSVYFQLGYNGNTSGYTERDCDQRSGNKSLVIDYLLIPDGTSTTGFQASKYCNNAIGPNNPITTTLPAPWYVVFQSGNQRAETDELQRGFEINYEILYSGCS